MKMQKIWMAVFVMIGLGVFMMRTHEFFAGGEEMNAQPSSMLELYNAVTGKMESAKRINKSAEEWKKELDSKAYHITEEKGTERPFSGEWNANKKHGIYICARCATHVFVSPDKFDSGTGWPSFTRPVHPNNMGYEKDRSWFMSRTEVRCPRCGAHLGHVFDDGPAPTGKRYCINSLALKFVEQDVPSQE